MAPLGNLGFSKGAISKMQHCIEMGAEQILL